MEPVIVFSQRSPVVFLTEPVFPWFIYVRVYAIIFRRGQRSICAAHTPRSLAFDTMTPNQSDGVGPVRLYPLQLAECMWHPAIIQILGRSPHFFSFLLQTTIYSVYFSITLCITRRCQLKRIRIYCSKPITILIYLRNKKVCIKKMPHNFGICSQLIAFHYLRANGYSLATPTTPLVVFSLQTHSALF